MKRISGTYKNIFDSKRKNGDIYKNAPDPFIIKVNGYYYLTSTVDKGISIKKSFDLIHWEFVNENDGVVTEDEDLRHAYAPEIMYENGKYYIVTSPNGGGHYLYCSDSINGPFRRLTDNFHESIDGSFFKESDGSIYFTRASETGIILKKFKSYDGDYLFDDKSLTFDEGILGGWTEGPYILKRYGYYYLTFTGTHFLSDAYRVAYLSGKELSNAGLKYHDFVLLSTKEEFKGLGHSMTFVGPNLDSYIIAYHNCDDNVKRNLCLTRLIFDNKGGMLANGVQKDGNHMFTRPKFEDFSHEPDYLSTKNFSSSIFSIEYNLLGAKAQGLFNYTSEDSYGYFKLEEDGIYCGLEKLVDVKNIKLDVYHSLRIQADGKRLAFYLDDVEYIVNYKIRLSGKIGYKNNELEEAYIAYSKYAFGNSDYEDVVYHEEFYLYRENEGKTIYIDIPEEGSYDLINISSCLLDVEQMEINGQEIKPISDNYLVRNIHLNRGINTFLLKQKQFFNGKLCFSKSCRENREYTLESILKEGETIGSYETRKEGIYFENDRNAILTKENLDEYEVSMTLSLEGNPILANNVIGLIASVNDYSRKNSFEGLTSLNGYMLMINRKKAYIYRANYHKSVVLKQIKLSNKQEFTLKLIKDNHSISFYIDNVKAYVEKIDFQHHLYKGQVGIYMNHASAIIKNFTIKEN